MLISVHIEQIHSAHRIRRDQKIWTAIAVEVGDSQIVSKNLPASTALRQRSPCSVSIVQKHLRSEDCRPHVGSS